MEFSNAFGHLVPSPIFPKVVVGWAKKEKGVSPLIFRNIFENFSANAKLLSLPKFLNSENHLFPHSIVHLPPHTT